jgi:hypothetical protein
MGVAEHLGAERAGVQPRACGEPIEQAPHVLDRLLALRLTATETADGPRVPSPPVAVRSENLLELGPEAHDALGARRLEPTPLVRAKVRVLQSRLTSSSSSAATSDSRPPVSIPTGW